MQKLTCVSVFIIYLGLITNKKILLTEILLFKKGISTNAFGNLKMNLTKKVYPCLIHQVQPSHCTGCGSLPVTGIKKHVIIKNKQASAVASLPNRILWTQIIYILTWRIRWTGDSLSPLDWGWHAPSWNPSRCTLSSIDAVSWWNSTAVCYASCLTRYPACSATLLSWLDGRDKCGNSNYAANWPEVLTFGLF